MAISELRYSKQNSKPHIYLSTVREYGIKKAWTYRPVSQNFAHAGDLNTQALSFCLRMQIMKEKSKL